MAGAVLTMKGTIGFEVIVAFMMYVRYFTQPLSQITQAAQSLQSAAAAGERVFEFLEAKEMDDESNKTKTLDNVKGDVSFEHVKFGYDEDRVIIHDFSADVQDGQKIAIVGPTGAGKTTMVKLLMRFYDVNKGAIKVDGHDVKNFNRSELHEMFGMVLQDTWLFSGTIMENIRYGKLDATDEEVHAAAKLANADSFIHKLPNGYDTVLTGDGANLSQGQRQLLAIARAAIADPPVLILDEATSSIDTRTEKIVQDGMDKLMAGRTTLSLPIVCQRSETVIVSWS